MLPVYSSWNGAGEVYRQKPLELLFGVPWLKFTGAEVPLAKLFSCETVELGSDGLPLPGAAPAHLRYSHPALFASARARRCITAVSQSTASCCTPLRWAGAVLIACTISPHSSASASARAQLI